MSQLALIDGTEQPGERRDLDFYATPQYQTRALLRRVQFADGWRVFEPCAGDGAIVRELPSSVDVVTNDVVVRDPLLPDFLLDARAIASWRAFCAADERFQVVITNPPFNEAFEIAQHAIEACDVGLILLLRLSWLEPTDERGPWLRAHPPTRVIVLPRHDYRGNGATDSVTSAWVIWSRRDWWVAPGVDFVTRVERNELIAAERIGR